MTNIDQPYPMGGFNCQTCGQWVGYGTSHTCYGFQPSSPQPPVNPCLCRAPFVPLTPEMIRLIVREELERERKERQQLEKS